MTDFWLYYKLGFTHVLDLNAYDHILFLTALTVMYTFKDRIKVVTLVSLFTVAHCFSLALSVYGVLRFNTMVVEFLIPVTIFVTAIFHVFTAGKTMKRNTNLLNYFFSFFFGLIHGLGFSHYFILLIGKKSSKLLPLSEFALGIETGQLLLVFTILVIGAFVQNFFRLSKRDWILITSSMIVGMSIPMLISTKFW